MKNNVKIYSICLTLIVFLSIFPLASAACQTDVELGYYIVHWYNYEGAGLFGRGEE